MTKFILIGGYPYKAADGGKSMCEEAITGINNPVRVLVCLFARKNEQWTKLLNDNLNFFKRNLLDTKLIFSLATEKDFLKQIEYNDLIYFNGGDTTDLANVLNRIDGWQEKLKTKTVMGSSAGAEIFSKYCYDIELFKISEHYGLVPVKMIVHYRSDKYTPPIGWGNALTELDNYKERLPIWTLSEGEYKVISVE